MTLTAQALRYSVHGALASIMLCGIAVKASADEPVHHPCHSDVSVYYPGGGGLLGAAVTAAVATVIVNHMEHHCEVESDNSAQALPKIIANDEIAVAKMPKDPVRRANLGRDYMHAGRFESASNAFADARSLGDSSPQVALNMALANIAIGKTHDAIALLDTARDRLPASDFGLAMALAGNTGQGIAILSDAVRSGDASPKLRQNLAYAFALDGRWADARLTASLDVPPDQLDARLGQWAQSMQAGGERDRVAKLLGVPVIADSGMPQTLALAGAAPMPAAAAAPQLASARTDASGELSPIAASAMPAPAAAMAVITPAVAPTAEPAPALAVFTPAVPVMAAPAAAAPAVPAQITYAAQVTPVATRAAYHSATHARHAANLGHVVQLGAFASAKGAERAKGIFAARNPQMRGHDFLITQAVVNGHDYWRVVSASYDASSAHGVCASLRQHGGACFAYAANHAPGGQTLAFADTHSPIFADRRRR
jgi:Flp pilus assembly protein TadD